ncbi:hypothetical protein LFYK43_22510 [Ligilactobacillus salitolerans]|uniref:Uncharacterized protein n=1 Tax=Ligilactobacillus salitolerans TaxID=1808352 RepID=A0A401IW97_9LACO|nr:hypothetical protein LFYK43_22510 [Ligilactobacillus salitolerans]
MEQHSVVRTNTAASIRAFDQHKVPDWWRSFFASLAILVSYLLQVLLPKSPRIVTKDFP